MTNTLLDYLIVSRSVARSALSTSVLGTLVAQYQKLALAVSYGFHMCQGGGGNVSVKYGDFALVKASGHRLDATTQDRGYVVLQRRVHARQSLYDGEDSRVISTTNVDEFPSIETPLHLDCAGAYVAHIHSVAAITRGLIETRHFVRSMNTPLVHFSLPGLPLLESLRSHSSWKAASGQLVLQNHGQICWANSLDECISLTLLLEDSCRSHLGVGEERIQDLVARVLLSLKSGYVDFSSCKSPKWLEFVIETPLLPDQVVYLHDIDLKALVIESTKIPIQDLTASQTETLALLSLIGHLIEPSEVRSVLSESETSTLVNDELEKRRMKL